MCERQPCAGRVGGALGKLQQPPRLALLSHENAVPLFIFLEIKNKGKRKGQKGRLGLVSMEEISRFHWVHPRWPGGSNGGSDRKSLSRSMSHLTVLPSFIQSSLNAYLGPGLHLKVILAFAAQ